MAASRDVIVRSKVGLHARPAALFIKTAGGFSARVTVNSDDGFESKRFFLAEEDVLVIVSFHEVENKTVHQIFCLSNA